MLTTSASYQLISKNLPRSLDQVAKRPEIARETAYYLANIGKIKSIDDFMADQRIFAYAMKAFGLADMTYAKGLIRKALTEGIADKNSFANTLADPRYREFVETFNFAQFGSATTVFASAQQGTVDRYVRQSLEEQAGQQNEGVRLALYFQRKAPNVTSALGILADKALLKVVQVALGIPAATSALDIDRQAQLISDRLDVADLKDPDKLKAFIDRFTVRWEAENQTSAPASTALLVSQPVEAGIGADLLASLQGLKLGGV